MEADSPDQRMLAAQQTEAAEAALVEQARSYSPAAWTTIFERHNRQIYSYVYYRVGMRELAEDLAAEVFVEALARIGSFRYRGTPLLAWLYRIAHNMTHDYLKAQGRSRTSLLSKLREEPLASGRDSPEGVALLQDLTIALRRLPAGQQEVIVLRFLQGLATAEVAQVLGKSEGAVKGLQSRALKSLRWDMVDKA